MRVFLFLALLLVLQNEVNCMIIKSGKKSCQQLYTATGQNISRSFTLKDPVEGHHLGICQGNLTCCTKQMENELYARSSRVLKDAVQRQTNATHSFFTTQASVFDDYFRNLLKTGKMKSHKMLLMTYKDNYSRNRHVFDDFLNALERYYTHGDVDLNKVCTVFLQKMQSAMFVLMKKNLANDQEFLNCSAKNIAAIKPFGQYHEQFASQLVSSFVFARKFVVALRATENTTASVINLLLRNECRSGFTKIQHCFICDGIPNALTCNATCANLLHSCFLLAPVIDKYWEDVMRQINLISSELVGRYNVEAVVGQLVFDISDAIMTFHGNFINIFSKAKSLCPSISSGRSKRAIDATGSDLYLEGERVRRDKAGFSSVTQGSGTSSNPPTLFKLIANFQKQFNAIKDVWKGLSKKICSTEDFVTHEENGSCWNGIELQMNSQDVPDLNRSNNIDFSARCEVVKQLVLLRRSLRDPYRSGKNLSIFVDNCEEYVEDDRPCVGSDDSDESGVSGDGAREDGSGSGGVECNIPKNVGSATYTESKSPGYSTKEPEGSITSSEAITTRTPTNFTNTPTSDDEDVTFSGAGNGTEPLLFSTAVQYGSTVSPSSSTDEDGVRKSVMATSPDRRTPTTFAYTPTSDDEDLTFSGSGNGTEPLVFSTAVQYGSTVSPSSSADEDGVRKSVTLATSPDRRTPTTFAYTPTSDDEDLSFSGSGNGTEPLVFSTTVQYGGSTVSPSTSTDEGDVSKSVTLATSPGRKTPTTYPEITTTDDEDLTFSGSGNGTVSLVFSTAVQYGSTVSPSSSTDEDDVRKNVTLTTTPDPADVSIAFLPNLYLLFLTVMICLVKL